MGRPKAMLEISAGCTLIEGHIAAARARCGAIAVVQGAVSFDTILGPAVRVVENPGWAGTGPFESLQLAARALEDHPGPLLVTPVDCPPVRDGDLTALLRATSGADAAVLSWDGRPGHPVWLSASLRARIAAAHTPTDGLRSFLSGARQVPASTPDVLLNLNTPEQWSRWLSSRSHQGSTV